MTELMVLASPMASASLTPSDPIVIYGNSDLVSQASTKGWTGDGSAENPYTIANLSFDAGSGTAISISETSLFVTIRSCTITTSYHGINIYRSSNVTIVGNAINGLSSGVDILLGSSNNNTISNNNCSGYRGMYLSSSNNNIISNNNCSGIIEIGIYLYSSNNNDVLDNNCSDNSFGIRSIWSTNNDFLNNTCNGNDQDGIWLDESSRSVLSHNTCNGNMFQGIFLEFSSNSTLTNNCCNSTFAGIRLSYSDNSTFSNNTGSNDYYGIFIEFSGNSIIINNTYRDISGGAILLGISNDSLVSNNTCIGGDSGIMVGSSSRCTVSNNTCTDVSGVGIYLNNCTGYMDGNTLVNCSFDLWADPLDVQEYVDVMKITSTNTVNGLPVYFLKNADLDGASVPSSGIGEIILLNVTDADISGLSMNYGGVVIGISSYLVIEDNKIDNATNPVCMFLSNHCIIDDNVFINAPWEGIFVGSSSNIIVSNNTCNGNGNGIYLDSSNNITAIDNSMVGSTSHGILLTASSNNTLVGNTIVDSADYGIYVMSSSSNLIYDNALIDNRGATSEYSSSHVQAYDDGTNTWNSTIRGNFWVDWQSNERYLIDGGSMADELPFYIVDSDAPEVTITSPAVGAWYNITVMNVTWTASDASGIANMSVSLDGGAFIDVTNYYYEFTALADGQHTVSVRAYDHAGNFQVASKVFNIEIELPSIVITEPMNDSNVGSTDVHVSWSGSSASGIGRYWISVDGGSFVDVGHNTSHLLSLANGQHIVIVKARDYAGNWNSTEVEFEIVDDVAPTATISPSGSNVAISSVIMVEFSEAMNISSVNIVVNGVAGTITWNGNVATLTPSTSLAYGTEYSITISGKDLAGNEMTSESTFTTLSDKGVICGSIKGADGNVVANATVTLSNGMTTITDVNGYFEFTGVPSGSYTLTITKDGFQTITQTVSTSAGETTDLATLSIAKTAPVNGDNGSILWTAGIFAVLVAALLVIGFLLYRRKNEKK
ncbi:MAG: NosD domain-containing protein [Methanomassiliicoccus sp.]|nr:NosD domain-containing protein [Methanomassiliicoccus sp.]